LTDPFEVQVAVLTHGVNIPVFHYGKHRTAKKLTENLANVSLDENLNSTGGEILFSHQVMYHCRLDV